MSRIDDLINELAPRGVEFKALASLGRRNAGTAMTAAKMKTIRAEDGPVRIFAGGQTIADVAEDAVPAKDIIREASIIVKSRGHVGFTYYERPFTHKAELWSYTLTHPTIDQKFVYYYLLTKVEELQEIARATSVKLPQLGVRDTDTLRIPLPPLEVQREIVRILDHFTGLEAELEAGLEAELEARRGQYAFYRDQLLAFPEAGVRSVPMGEVLSLRAGKFISASEISAIRDSEHPYPCFGGNGLRGYVAKPNHEGDFILIGRQGALSGNIKRVSGEFYATEHALVVSPVEEFNTAWLFHELTAMNLNRYVSQGAQPGLAVTILSKVLIPVPRLVEQNRTAAILDTFDALVTDLSSGLSAELSARRQQYEHYRDRLLTFAEAA